MTKDLITDIRGEGKGGSTPVEAPDSLKSNTTGSMQILFSEGEIGGLSNGDKSIFFDDVPYQLSDNSYSRKGVSVFVNNGTPSQPSMPSFESSATTVSVGGELLFNVPNQVTFTDNNVTAIKITLSVTAFFHVDDDGNTNGTSANHTVEISSNGGAFVHAATCNLNGKQSSSAEVDFYIHLNGKVGQHIIKLTRSTPDSVDLKLTNGTYFKSYTKIVEHRFQYPNRAIGGFIFDAEQFGNKLPKITADMDGIKCQVPHNYDADTRKYTGAFNGSFAAERKATSCPPWILYELMTNKRFGLGQFIDPSYLNVASLYDIAKWCDTRVAGDKPSQDCTAVFTAVIGTIIPVGGTFGYEAGGYIMLVDANEAQLNRDFVITSVNGTQIIVDSEGVTGTATGGVKITNAEPRFEINVQIMNRGEAFEVLQDLMASFRGMLFWMDSQLVAMADMPRDPVKLVTNSNVKGGTFSYSGENNKNRYSIINVSFSDASNNYEKTIETVEWTHLIEELGWKPKDFGSFGVTSRSMARRVGEAILEAQENETEMVTYTASYDHLAVDHDNGYMGIAPADVVLISDVHRGNALGGGRIVSGTTSSCIMDREITEGSGTGSIYIELADGTMLTKPCTYAGNVVTAAFGTAPQGGNVFILVEAAEAEPFIIISVVEEAQNEFNISALKYDETKYDRIYRNVDLDTKQYMRLPNPNTMAAVENVTVTEGIILKPSGSVRTLTVKWDKSEDVFFSEYKIGYTIDNGQQIWLPNTQANEVVIETTRAGVYNLQLIALNKLGVSSVPTLTTFTLAVLPPEALLPVSTIVGFELQGGGTDFAGRDIKLKWIIKSPKGSYAIDNTNAFNEYSSALQSVDFQDCVVTVKTTGDVLLRQEIVVGTNYIYDYEKNVEDNLAIGGLAQRTVKVTVTVRDVRGRQSPDNTITFTNPVPDVPTGISVVGGYDTTYINFNRPRDTDYEGVQVYLSQTSGFTPSGANLVYEGDSDTLTLVTEGADGEARYIRIMPYDVFGRTGLNVSSELYTTNKVISVDADQENWTVVGFQFVAEEVAADRLIWTAGSVTVQKGAVVDTYAVTAGQFNHTSGTAYFYYIKGETIIRYTTTLATAIGVDRRVFATYKGGTDLVVAHGDVLIDGAKLLAGTIGAGNLIAGEVIVTGAAQIQDGIITNAKIGNIIQSTNWNETTKQGWKINKAGNIQANAITIYDPSGNVVLSSGTVADDINNSALSGVIAAAANTADWPSITGSNRPADNADITDYADYRVTNDYLDSGVRVVERPRGAAYQYNGNVTGAVIIVLPLSWTNTMIKMEIEFYNYTVSDRSFTLTVGGYNYSGSNQWINAFAKIMGNTESDNQVRFGHNGTNCVIIIGDGNSVWNYPKIRVHSVTLGHSNYTTSAWAIGWDIVVLASLAGITISGDISNNLIDAKSITNQGAFATENQITSANSGTYIANAAIKTAHILDLQINKVTSGSMGAIITLTGSSKIIFQSSTHMKVQGIGFGIGSKLIEWYGVNMPVSAMSIANSLYHMTTDGDVYNGDSNVRRNQDSVTTTGQTDDISISFSSAGSAIKITAEVTYSYRWEDGEWEPEVEIDTTTNVGWSSCTLYIDEYVGTTWINRKTVTETGNYQTNTGDNPTWPPPFVSEYIYSHNISGIDCVYDAPAGSTSRVFRARIVRSNTTQAGAVQMVLIKSEE